VSNPIKYERRTRQFRRVEGEPARYAAYIPPSMRDASNRACIGIIVTEMLRADTSTRMGWRATGRGLDGNLYAYSVGRTRDEAVDGLLHRGIKVDDDTEEAR
jgi:hypothetical protein